MAVCVRMILQQTAVAEIDSESTARLKWHIHKRAFPQGLDLKARALQRRLEGIGRIIHTKYLWILRDLTDHTLAKAALFAKVKRIMA